MDDTSKSTPKSNAEALVDYVSASIASDPYEFNASVWCRRSNSDRAAAIGLSSRTIQDLVKLPPFVTDRCLVDGRQTSLVRIGEKTPEDLVRVNARKMVVIFRKHAEKNTPAAKAKLLAKRAEIVAEIEAAKAKNPTPKLTKILKELKREKKEIDASIGRIRTDIVPQEFGMLSELAKVWPKGQQVSMFAMVFERWQDFMAGVKTAQAGTDDIPYFFDFPHIPTVLKYRNVAVEMMMMDAQASNKPKSKALLKLTALA